MINNRKQHVVPQLYLRPFSGINKRLACLNKADGTISYSRPKDVAFEPYAFAIPREAGHDSSFDSINNAVENFTGPAWKDFAHGAQGKDQLNAIWVLSANLLTRSRSIRDALNRGTDRLLELLARPGAIPLLQRLSADPALAPLGFGAWDPSSIPEVLKQARNVQFPISLMLLDDVAKTLAHLKCDLYRTSSNVELCTSDDPVVFTKSRRPFTVTGGLPEIIAATELEITIPLLPSLACVWRKGANLKEMVISDQECDTLNRQVHQAAYSEVYASTGVPLMSLWEKRT